MIAEYSTDTLDLTPRVEGRGAYLKSLTFITAFLLHVSLEGFALGVQVDFLLGFIVLVSGMSVGSKIPVGTEIIL